MLKVNKLLVAIVALPLIVYGAYKLIYPTYIFRFKMTLDAKVDGKISSASSVVEVRLHRQPQALPQMPFIYQSMVGEAAFLQLPSGRNIVMLLAGGPWGSDFPRMVVASHFGLRFQEGDLAKFENVRGRWELSPGDMPHLVSFDDPANPATLQTIDPSSPTPWAEHIDISIEMTSEAPTAGRIKQFLPWVDDQFRYTENLQIKSRITRPLNPTDFIRN